MHERIALVNIAILGVKYFRVARIDNVLYDMCKLVHFGFIVLMELFSFVQLVGLLPILPHHVLLPNHVVAISHPNA